MLYIKTLTSVEIMTKTLDFLRDSIGERILIGETPSTWSKNSSLKP